MLSALVLADSLQPLAGFDIAVGRRCLQQDLRLLAASWDAVARKIKLREWKFGRAIPRSERSPQLACDGASTLPGIRIAMVSSGARAICRSRGGGIRRLLACRSGCHGIEVT